MMEALIKEGNGETSYRLIQEILKKLQEVLLSSASPNAERAAALQLIEILSVMTAEEFTIHLPKFVQLLHMELAGRRDSEPIEATVNALAKVVLHAGILTNELLESEANFALENLQDERGEFHHVLCGILMLTALFKDSTGRTVLSGYVSAVLDVIWCGLYHSKQLIRERAADLLALCMAVLRSNKPVKCVPSLFEILTGAASTEPHYNLTPYQLFRLRVLEDAHNHGLRTSHAPQIHGSLLVLLRLYHDDHFAVIEGEGEAGGSSEWQVFYCNLIEILFKLAGNKDQAVRTSVIKLIAEISGFSVFSQKYLGRWMSQLQEAIKKDPRGDRLTILKALKVTLKNVQRPRIDEYLQGVGGTLRSVLLLRGRHRVPDEQAGALECCVEIARIGGTFTLISLLPIIFPPSLKCSSIYPSRDGDGNISGSGSIAALDVTSGYVYSLWPKLVESLEDICQAQPESILHLENGLVEEIFRILHLPNGTTSLEVEEQQVCLALKCLGAFDFSVPFFNPSLVADHEALVTRIVRVHLNHSSAQIRAAAASNLLKLSFKHLRQSAPQFRWTCQPYFTAVLTRLAADEDPLVAEAILGEFKERAPVQDKGKPTDIPENDRDDSGSCAVPDPTTPPEIVFEELLAQTECIRPLFVFMSSARSSGDLRERCAEVLSRVSNNAVLLLPFHRRLLLQYLSEIECAQSNSSSTSTVREDLSVATSSPNEISVKISSMSSSLVAGRLLRRILEIWPVELIYPYIEGLLRALVPKIQDVHVEFADHMMGALRRLIKIFPGCLDADKLREIVNVLADLAQDQSCLIRRRGALLTLQEIFRRAGHRERLSGDFLVGRLMLMSVNILKTGGGELDQSLRAATIRLIGVLGAVDPYTIKSIETQPSQALSMASLSTNSTPLATSAASSPPSPGISYQATPEEFFAQSVLTALMKVLDDPSLLAHHLAATQAIVNVFKGLGQGVLAAHPNFLTSFLTGLFPNVRTAWAAYLGLGSGGSNNNNVPFTLDKKEKSPSSSPNALFMVGSSIIASLPHAINSSSTIAGYSAAATTTVAASVACEFYFNHLAALVGVVGIHIRPHVGELIETILLPAWDSFFQGFNLIITGPMIMVSMLSLIDSLVTALKGEFRAFVPVLLPRILQIFGVGAGGLGDYSSLFAAPSSATVCSGSVSIVWRKALHSLALLGGNLNDWAGVVGDTLVGVLRISAHGDTWRAIRISALRCCTGLCHDIAAIADNPAILQTILMILDDKDAAMDVQEFCLDSIVMVGIAQGRDFFRLLPLLVPVLYQRSSQSQAQPQSPLAKALQQHAALQKLIDGCGGWGQFIPSTNSEGTSFRSLSSLSKKINSPARLAELTYETLKLMEMKIADFLALPSAPLSSSSTAKFQLNLGLLKRSWELPATSANVQEKSNGNAGTVQQATNASLEVPVIKKAATIAASREEWLEWIRRLGIELLREAPSAALRSCASLANSYNPLARELFNAAFASCWGELDGEGAGEFVEVVEAALSSPSIPSECAQILLNLAEFMERLERPLPIDIGTLGALATKFHAYAKALYYKELEYLASVQHGSSDTSIIGAPGCDASNAFSSTSPTPSLIESLITINNQIQAPDAAVGILLHAHQTHGMVLKESWYEKLNRWPEALKAYEAKWAAAEIRDETVATTAQESGTKNPFVAIEAVFGILRCRHALGEWEELEEIAKEIWPTGSASLRSSLAPLGAAAAWGLQDWGALSTYTEALRQGSAESSFFQSILAIVNPKTTNTRARELIEKTREAVETELTALLSESYSRAYNAVVRVQMLTELEEVADFHEAAKGQDDAETSLRSSLLKSWMDRLQRCQQNVEVWMRILKVRSLIISPQGDPGLWIQFASMCRKSGRSHLAQKILTQLLEEDLGPEPSLSPSQGQVKRSLKGLKGSELLARINLQRANPQVVYAYLKYLWDCGDEDRRHALRMMKGYAKFLSQTTTEPKSPMAQQQPQLATTTVSNNNSILARCYYKSSKWEKQLITESLSSSVTSNDQSTQPPTTTSTTFTSQPQSPFKAVLDGYLAATAYDKTWHKAWHAWALMNFEMASGWERSQQQQGIQSILIHPLTGSSTPSINKQQHRINPYIVPAIQGFFRSISLSDRNSLQDSLRLLTLWFKYGGNAEINAAVGDGFFTVPVDNWLQVIPQLIARIHVTSPQVRRLVHHVLSDIGRHHPQALIYSLTVAAKSQNVTRKAAALAILDKMRSHSATLVDQALLVAQELIRVAILWEEMWHEGLEEASKLYFSEHNIPAMFGVLEPLHQMVEKGGQSAREASFIQSYGHELREAKDLGSRYKQSGNASDLNAAWDLYYQVFRRINKSLPQITVLDLESVSSRLLKCRNLELAIPGSYRAHTEIIRIAAIVPNVGVIASKQRPRQVIMQGSNGQEYLFLLKGHEDLRQDERVMQLFGLVNTLLQNDPETHKRHLGIERFSVIPLSQNTGLIGWLPHCDTLHTLIKSFRETRGIPLSLEHRAMLQFAPDYDHLTKLQKVEVFDTALKSCDGTDLARIFWLQSENAEEWFERRRVYARSLAVMSVVGYILGLGDRHPSNLMVDKRTGKIVHIDFGDCFEVAMERERFPEKVPFRLTRMLIKALEVSGVEGTFRITSEETMRVLRTNKDSVMAVLEAFVYDPLINWRLLTRTTANTTQIPEAPGPGSSETLSSFPQTNPMAAGSWAKFPENFSSSRKIRRDSEISKLEEESLARPEALNSGALSVINRVSSKLTGKDFPKPSPVSKSAFRDSSAIASTSHQVPEDCEWPLTVQSQVDGLIHEATNLENLCQSYVGWCPFW